MSHAGALAFAGAQVAAVRDDPAARLALMARVFHGPTRKLTLSGPRVLQRAFRRWFAWSAFAPASRRADERKRAASRLGDPEKVRVDQPLPPYPHAELRSSRREEAS